MFNQLLRKAAGVVGGTIDFLGKTNPGIKPPEFKISETLQKYAQPPKAYASGPSVQGASTVKLGSNPTGNTTSFGPYLPSTGGQAATGGGGSYNTASTGSFDLGGGGDSGPDLGALRDAFAGIRSTIEGQLPGLEQTYNQTKGDIEAGLGRAKATYDDRVTDINRGFGTNLKSLLMTDRDIARQNRNVYSSLGTLDSSSFAEAENKRQQNVFDTQSKLTMDKERQLREGEREYQAYEAEGNRAMAQAASEYMQGKQALQAALAQNKLDEAYQIMDAMNQAQARAQQVQDTLNAFKLNLAQLQASGTNVIGNLGKLGAGSLNNILGSFQSNYANPARTALALPSSGMAGSGYIGQSDDEQRKLFGRVA